MKYRILVIDDEFKTRKEYLLLAKESRLHDFEIISEERVDGILSQAEKCHIAIVDVMLRPGTEPPFHQEGVNIIDALEKANPHLPIYVISQHWADLETEAFVSYYLSDRIVGGASYSSLQNFNGRGKISADLIKHIHKSMGSVPLDIGPNDDLIMIHLSDIQFSGKWELKSSIEQNTPEDIITDILSSLPRDKIGKMIKPHIAIFTGDIADKALPKGFASASKHLNDFCNKLDIGRHCRFVVPGNHDISIPLSCSCQIEFNRTTNTPNLTNTSTEPALLPYSMALFRDFSREFTARDDWDLKFVNIDNPLSGNLFISKTLSKYGFNVIGISTVSMADCFNPNNVQISNKLLTALGDELQSLNENNPNALNLYLMHHSPWPEPLSDLNLKKDGEEFRSKISLFNDAFIAYGHNHKGTITLKNFTDDPNQKTCVISAAPTPTLAPDKRPPDTVRGFNLINFHRKNDQVTGFTGTRFTYSRPSFSPVDNGIFFERDAEDGWIKKTKKTKK